MDKRISSMDGLRGIAVLMVISFHAFSRWPEVLPYGNQYDFFHSGSLGVELFFLISGFVIFISLEKSGALKIFLFKRWLRLFPAMLIASIIIYITSFYFTERPMGKPELSSLLPGLSFIDESWWSIALGKPVSPLEGSFWSLYVEVKFYIFAALIYYWKGKFFLIKSLLGLFLFAIIIHALDASIDYLPLHRIEQLSDALSINYFGWFAAGACFYEFHKTNVIKWFIFGIMIALLCSFTIYDVSYSDKLIILVLSLIFAYSLINTRLQRILQSKFLLFFGLISYPLYLLHENMMVSIIIKLDTLDTGIALFLLPAIAVMFISVIAYIIVRFIEPAVKNSFKKFDIQKSCLASYKKL